MNIVLKYAVGFIGIAASFVSLTAMSGFDNSEYSCFDQARVERYIKEFKIVSSEYKNRGIEFPFCDNSSHLKKLLNAISFIESLPDIQVDGYDNYYIYLRSNVVRLAILEDLDRSPLVMATNRSNFDEDGGNITANIPFFHEFRSDVLSRAAILIHEARHTKGWPHATCKIGVLRGEPACDESFEYHGGGAYSFTASFFLDLWRISKDDDQNNVNRLAESTSSILSSRFNKIDEQWFVKGYGIRMNDNSVFQYSDGKLSKGFFGGERFRQLAFSASGSLPTCLINDKGCMIQFDPVAGNFRPQPRIAQEDDDTFRIFDVLLRDNLNFFISADGAIYYNSAMSAYNDSLSDPDNPGLIAQKYPLQLPPNYKNIRFVQVVGGPESLVLLDDSGKTYALEYRFEQKKGTISVLKLEPLTGTKTPIRRIRGSNSDFVFAVEENGRLSFLSRPNILKALLSRKKLAWIELPSQAGKVIPIADIFLEGKNRLHLLGSDGSLFIASFDGSSWTEEDLLFENEFSGKEPDELLYYRFFDPQNLGDI